jgi:hypothetical protein
MSVSLSRAEYPGGIQVAGIGNIWWERLLLEAWILWEGPDDQDFQMLMGSAPSPGGSDTDALPWAVGIAGEDMVDLCGLPRLIGELVAHSEEGPTCVSTLTTIRPGEWTHVAASFSGSRWTVFINGVASERAPELNGPHLLWTSEGVGLRIGRGETTEEVFRDHYSGLIDDLRVSFKHIEADFTPPERMVDEAPEPEGATPETAVSGTVILYHFDEGFGHNVSDSADGMSAYSGVLWSTGSSGPQWSARCVGEDD